MSNFKPSKYQQAIFDWVKGDHRALVVEALAGSGKTTTGIQLLKYIPEDKKVAFVTFNVLIKDHINELLGKNSSFVAKTYNSFGNSIVLKSYPGSKCVKGLNYINYDALFWKDDPYKNPVIKLASLIKANLCPLTDIRQIKEIIDRHDIDIDVVSIEELIQKTTSFIRYGLDHLEEYTFDDQCWLPTVLDLPCEKYDFIFIDEAQDTNKAQLEMIYRSMAPNGRIVAVGDRHQSIYAFRGADSMAMENIIEKLQPDILPLPISYRCPTSHVDQCHRLFPEIEIEAAPWAIEGTINEHVNEHEFMYKVKPGDMVLCRTNAPLVPPAFDLMKRGVKVSIKGLDIGNNLISILKRSGVKKYDSLNEVKSKVTKFASKEINKLFISQKKNFELSIVAIEDKRDTIINFCEEVKDYYELENKIKEMYSDNGNPDIVFSTVHKAKGLEADNVFILGRDKLMPHPKATDPIDKEQERNIMYVAFTRAKQNLYYVSMSRK